MSVTSAFDRLKEKLREVGNPVAGRLAPGLPRAEVLAKLSALPYPAHPDVIEFYQNCNGSDAYTEPQHHGLVYRRFCVPTLDVAVERIGWDYHPDHAYPAAPRPEWNGCWELPPTVPILQEDAYFYLVPYAPGLEAPQPVFYLPEDDGPSPAFSSVEAMLNTLYAWYDEGALTVDAEGNVDETDLRRYPEIGARENPGITSWAEPLALYPRRY